MFDPYCPKCDNRVLVGYRSLRSMDNNDKGIVMFFDCPTCGGEAVLVTGAKVHEHLAHQAA